MTMMVVLRTSSADGNDVRANSSRVWRIKSPTPSFFDASFTVSTASDTLFLLENYAGPDPLNFCMAGVPGFEPGPKVLETSMLTVNTIPLPDAAWPVCGRPFIGFKVLLFIFPVQCMATATAAKLFELQPVRRALFVFRRYVVAFFAFRTLQYNVISRHNTSTIRPFFPLYCL